MRNPHFNKDSPDGMEKQIWMLYASAIQTLGFEDLLRGVHFSFVRGGRGNKNKKNRVVQVGQVGNRDLDAAALAGRDRVPGKLEGFSLFRGFLFGLLWHASL